MLSKISILLLCTRKMIRQWCLQGLKSITTYDPCWAQKIPSTHLVPFIPLKPSTGDDAPIVEFNSNLSMPVDICRFNISLYTSINDWPALREIMNVHNPLRVNDPGCVDHLDASFCCNGFDYFRISISATAVPPIFWPFYHFDLLEGDARKGVLQNVDRLEWKTGATASPCWDHFKSLLSRHIAGSPTNYETATSSGMFRDFCRPSHHHVKPTQQLNLWQSQAFRKAHRSVENHAELISAFWARMKRSIPSHSNIPHCTQHRVSAFIENSSMLTCYGNIIIPRLYWKSNVIRPSFSHQSLRTRHSNGEHDLTLLHFHDFAHLVTIGKISQLLVMVEDKWMRNTLLSCSSYAQLFSTLGGKPWPSTTTATATLRVLEPTIRRSLFSPVFFASLLLRHGRLQCSRPQIV